MPRPRTHGAALHAGTTQTSLEREQMASFKPHSAAASRADRPALASRLWMGVAVALLLLGFGLIGLWLTGFQFIAFRGHSMEPTFSPGALLIARSTPPDLVQVGDVIVFSAGVRGQPDIVHRVVTLHENRPVATTMGDNNLMPDPDTVLLSGPVPRIVWSTPIVGWWITPAVGMYLLMVSSVMTALVVLRHAGRLFAERRPSSAISEAA